MPVFLKDFDREDIFGVVIDQSNFDYVNDLLLGVNIILCRENEQLLIAPSSIDVIISFSGFSHINEDSTLYWLAELYGVLRIGGFAVITSWGRSLFDIFNKI